MIYTGKMVPFAPELSRVSYDPTPLMCENEGCGQPVFQFLIVPGEQIGRPGRTYRVTRCLNCIFFGIYCTYFDSTDRDLPVRVVFDPDDAECQHFLAQRKVEDWPNLASLKWQPGPPDSDALWSCSIAGGEPEWMQEPVEVRCPSCAQPMEFILQLASHTIDPYFHAPELKSAFYLKIEYYATLYLFACESCNITASVTQCS